MSIGDFTDRVNQNHKYVIGGYLMVNYEYSLNFIFNKDYMAVDVYCNSQHPGSRVCCRRSAPLCIPAPSTSDLCHPVAKP